MQNNTIKELKGAVSDTIGLGLGSVTLTIKFGAGALKLLKNAVESTPDVGVSIIQTPLAAYEGVLTQGENGMSAADAHTKAYRYVNQPLATTITQVATSAGSMAAEMWADLDDEPTKADDDNANTAK